MIPEYFFCFNFLRKLLERERARGERGGRRYLCKALYCRERERAVVRANVHLTCLERNSSWQGHERERAWSSWTIRQYSNIHRPCSFVFVIVFADLIRGCFVLENLVAEAKTCRNVFEFQESWELYIRNKSVGIESKFNAFRFVSIRVSRTLNRPNSKNLQTLVRWFVWSIDVCWILVLVTGAWRQA